MNNKQWWACLILLWSICVALPVEDSGKIISLTLNATQHTACSRWQLLKKELAELAEVTIDQLITDDVCRSNASSTEHVKIFAYVMHKNGKEADNDVTTSLYRKLVKQQYIGNFKIVNVVLKEPSVDAAVEDSGYSLRTILIVIGVVLTFYMGGYFLILSMKSYSTPTNSKDREPKFIIVSENKYFSEADGGGRSKLGGRKIRVAGF